MTWRTHKHLIGWKRILRDVNFKVYSSPHITHTRPSTFFKRSSLFGLLHLLNAFVFQMLHRWSIWKTCWVFLLFLLLCFATHTHTHKLGSCRSLQWLPEYIPHPFGTGISKKGNFSLKNIRTCITTTKQTSCIFYSPVPVACFAFRLIVGKRVLYYWAGGKLMSRNK